MPDFWLGTYRLNAPLPATAGAAEPLITAGSRTLAVEVMAYEGEYALLLSTADNADNPRSLNSLRAFANGPKSCSVWQDRGFPLVDASIRYQNRVLEVRSACFAQAESMQYDELLLTISGLDFEHDSSGVPAATYAQFYEVPDSAFPATLLRRTAVNWNPSRTGGLSATQAPLTIKFHRTRYPGLGPFDSTPPPTPVKAWSGQIGLPATAAKTSATSTCESREDLYGEPAFRFEKVEVVGFRIDLEAEPGVDAALAELVEPLNFHLDGSGPIVDFRYQPATRTVLVELLRYGRMQLRTQRPPLTDDDYQSQHELLVRILVGRVDDDTSQARTPAVFCPAVFVDNPWSKIIGRDLQGFDKRMAWFCVETKEGNVPLTPDGLLPRTKQPCSLAEISRIRMFDRSGDADPSKGGIEKPLLDITYPSGRPEGWDDFRSVDVDLALNRLSLADTRWRQIDFDGAEFRRSFATAAVGTSVRGFRSVQVSPVGQRSPPGRPPEWTWITSTFALDADIQVAYPVGGVDLVFHENTAAPKPWTTLCRLLGNRGDGRQVRSLQTGNWYRLKFSMTMTVDNGLEWGD